MSHRLRLGAPFAFALLTAPAAAQAPPGPPPVFGETVEVRVVNLEVVVTDRDGLPVTGLAPEDFRLTVDGEEVPIRYFTEVRGGDAVEGVAQAGAVAGIPDLVPGSPVGTSYLVFVDDFFSMARDRDRVLKSLREELGRLGPEDRMAIVAFDGNRLAMLTTWTGSTPELERAIQKATNRPAYGLQRLAEKRNVDADNQIRRATGGGRNPLETRLEAFEIFYAERLEQQVSNVVSAAGAALRGFANPPGRKVLLMLSGGWPYDPADFAANEFGRPIVEPGIRRGERLYAPLVDTANQLGYTIYSIDVPGLASESFNDAELFDPPQLADQAKGFLRETNTQWSIQYIAQQTGGKALINARRMAALQTAAADTRSYYWIGFVPTWQGNDSRHRAKVEVRRAGLRVRSRSSYVDMSRSTETGMAVESVLLFGGGPGVRPLAVAFGRPQKSSMNAMKVEVEIGIPLDGLTLVPSAGGFATEVELRIAALDDRGGRSEVPVVPVRLEIQDKPAPGQFVKYTTTLELRRTLNHVVVAVYDPVSGAIHSATADIRP
jgi:VWFA-related protein